MKSMACLAVSAAFAMSCGAQSLGNLADVTIIDRDTGVALSPHYYRGEYWVAGRPGARYAIEVRNRLGERVLAVTSVDGVNVLSGADAAWDQAGYVFDGGESYQITGWRKSASEIAAFTFTASPDSYAERTGRPANVGVIGVALFREKQPAVTYSTPPRGHSPVLPDELAPAASAGVRSDQLAGLDSRARSESRASSAPGASAAKRAAAPPEVAQIGPPARAVAAPKLGTGHGEREYSYINYTEFARLQPQPNELIRIRYDSMDNLLAMGVIKRPRPIAPNMNPFPGSPQQPQFVPDPPG